MMADMTSWMNHAVGIVGFAFVLFIIGLVGIVVFRFVMKGKNWYEGILYLLVWVVASVVLITFTMPLLNYSFATVAIGLNNSPIMSAANDAFGGAFSEVSFIPVEQSSISFSPPQNQPPTQSQVVQAPVQGQVQAQAQAQVQAQLQTSLQSQVPAEVQQTEPTATPYFVLREDALYSWIRGWTQSDLGIAHTPEDAQEMYRYWSQQGVKYTGLIPKGVSCLFGDGTGIAGNYERGRTRIHEGACTLGNKSGKVKINGNIYDEWGPRISGAGEWPNSAYVEIVPTSTPTPIPTATYRPTSTPAATIQPTAQPAPAATAEPAVTAEPEIRYHTVKAGEGLIMIANFYNVDWKKLCELNALSDCGHLYRGQKLEIPSH